jgi:hypothetical protein
VPQREMQKNTIYSHDFPRYDTEQSKYAINHENTPLDKKNQNNYPKSDNRAKMSDLTTFKEEYPGHAP